MTEKLPETPCSRNVLSETTDLEYAEYVFTELEKLQVSLDSDPMFFGPARLNEKIFQSTAALSQCERIFADAIRKQHECRRKETQLSAALKLEKDNLFATDPEVRAGRNVSDREALANTKLMDMIKEIQGLELTLQSLEMAITLIVAKRRDLLGIRSALKQQHQLCQEELGIGRKWGRTLERLTIMPDKPSPVRTEETEADEDDDKSLIEIDQLLGLSNDEPKKVAGEDPPSESFQTWAEKVGPAPIAVLATSEDVQRKGVYVNWEAIGESVGLPDATPEQLAKLTAEPVRSDAPTPPESVASDVDVDQLVDAIPQVDDSPLPLTEEDLSSLFD
jgi:hypothetical protein